jgi:hypothetical protein
MTIDLQAVARQFNSDPARVRTALTLLEQGFFPSYLLQYRSDELAGIPPEAVWALHRMQRDHRRVEQRRTELRERLAPIVSQRPDLKHQIDTARWPRELDHVARCLKNAAQSSNARLLAARIWHPNTGDSSDPAELAAAMFPELPASDRERLLDVPSNGARSFDTQPIGCWAIRSFSSQRSMIPETMGQAIPAATPRTTMPMTCMPRSLRNR